MPALFGVNQLRFEIIAMSESTSRVLPHSTSSEDTVLRPDSQISAKNHPLVATNCRSGHTERHVAEEPT